MPHINIVSASMMTVLLSMTYFPAAATASSGTPDAVSSTTIPLPAGNYATLNLLGAAVNGNQTNQSFVVTNGRHDHHDHAKPERLVGATAKLRGRIASLEDAPTWSHRPEPR